MKIKLKGGYVPYKMSPEELEVYLRERKRGLQLSFFKERL